MILHCDFEELRALKEGARIVLEGGADEGGPIAAPPAGRAHVQRLLPRLDGDLTIETLDEQRSVALALDVIVEGLRAEMESAVVAYHPAEDTAVDAYFAFSHALTVQNRIQEMGREMEDVIELVTGEKATDEVARTFVFPD